MPITPEEKLVAIKRELGYRRYVYPRRVGVGKMSQKQADKEIVVMEAIEADYEREVREQRLI